MAKLKKRDLLKEIYEKKITEKEAQALWNDIEGFDAFAQIGIKTFKERLAISILPFKVVAKWRYEGWPHCAICGEVCDVEAKEGFPVKKIDIKGKIIRNSIIHYRCQPLPYANIRELPVWGVIEKAMDDLQESQEMRITTLYDDVVGDLVQALIKHKNIKGLL